MTPMLPCRWREVQTDGSLMCLSDKFVAGLTGREGLTILRKSGTWENWMHDSAVVEGKDRQYIIVGMTNHPKGDEYLVEFGRGVDDFMRKK